MYVPTCILILVDILLDTITPWCLQKTQATEESQIPDRFKLAHSTFCSSKDGINSHPWRLTPLLNVVAAVLLAIEIFIGYSVESTTESSMNAKNRLKGGGHSQPAVEQGSEAWVGNFWLICPHSPHTIPVACHSSFRIQLESRSGKESVDLCSPPHFKGP